MIKINIFLIAVFFLTSCGNVGKVLRNEKISTTDEFLVKKKGPLVLPPDFEKIPVPESIEKKNKNDDERIKKIIKMSNTKNKVKNESSSLEDSILKSIRK